jgi:hydrogenase nickel incorporation protein HypA/HybF
MHEMAIAESMMEIVEAAARRNAAARVSAIRLELGALSAIEQHALTFCFDAVSRGSLAEGARLEIVTLPGEAWCMPCGERVGLQRRGDPCPQCGSHQLEVLGGDAMRVKEIEIA